MTVNELIAELQVLVAQGHGELDVVATEVGDCGDNTTMINLSYVTFGCDFLNSYWKAKDNWKEEKHFDQTYSVKGKDYIYLEALFSPS